MKQDTRFNEFVAAQNAVYDQVRAELRGGRKETHWMWFVFPQLAGLGMSAMSRKFTIASLDEARAYLQHAVLGERLLECTRWVLVVKHRTVRQIFGSPDDAKFRSSMTLFSLANPGETLFGEALTKYFEGELDSATVALLAKANG